MDPNPMAQKREARKIEEQAAEAVRRALPAEFVAEIEGAIPGESKRERIDGGFGLQGYEAPDDIWYAKAKIEAAGANFSEAASGQAPLVEEKRIEESNDNHVVKGDECMEMSGGIFLTLTAHGIEWL